MEEAKPDAVEDDLTQKTQPKNPQKIPRWTPVADPVHHAAHRHAAGHRTQGAHPLQERQVASLLGNVAENKNFPTVSPRSIYDSSSNE